MTEYEWEVGRLPKSLGVKGFLGPPPRKGPVAEYTALEFPRESVTWVVNTVRDRELKRPATVKPKATTSVKQGVPQT